MKLINDQQVADKFGHSRATTWRKTKENPDFPKPIRLQGARATRWIEAEVDAYIQRQVNNARGIA